MVGGGCCRQVVGSESKRCVMCLRSGVIGTLDLIAFTQYIYITVQTCCTSWCPPVSSLCISRTTLNQLYNVILFEV